MSHLLASHAGHEKHIFANAVQDRSDKVIQQPSFLPTSFFRSTNLTGTALPLLVCAVTGRMTLPRSLVLEGPMS